MFGVGWTEMLVVGVVALIVIGPKDLPVVMARLGKMVTQIRRLGGEFQREINKTTGLDQITDLRRSITEPLKSVASEITRDFNRVTTTGETVPTGAIAPKTAGSESVVAEIHEKVGLTPPPPAVVAAAPVVAATLESPAPAEAVAPAKRAPRKPRTPAAPRPPETAASPASVAPAKRAAPKSTATGAPPAARKPRSLKPKAEG